MQPIQTPESFKEDVALAVAEKHAGGESPDGAQAAPAGGSEKVKSGLSFEKIKSGLAKVDSAFQKIAPVITALTPDQYDALVEGFADLIHGLSGAVNKAPAT